MSSSSSTDVIGDGNPKDALVDAAMKSYRSLALVPNITAGRLLDVQTHGGRTSCSLGSTYSQRDLERQETRKFDKFFKADIEWESNAVEVASFPFQAERHEIVIQSFSNDGKSKAIIRKVKKKEKEVFYLEVWSSHGLERSFNLTDAKKHVDVYGEVTMASLQWSKDGTKLIYIAEKKKQDQDNSKKKEDKVLFNLDSGEKYAYEDDWGEQKEGLRHPVIVVFHISSGDIKVVDNIPDHLSPGQCIWNGSNSIIFVGWWHVPFRLGMVYCENRRSAIFQVDCDDEKSKVCRQLSNDNCAVNSPRVSPDGSSMIFLERDVFGPHRGCERLMKYDFKSESKPSVVYDIVDEVTEQTIGLYCHSLPQRCWLRNGEFAVMHTNFKTDKVVLIIEIASGNLTKITNEAGSWSILDTKDDVLLASFATPNQPACLKIGRLNTEKLEVFWKSLESGQYLQRNFISDFTWEMFPVKLPEAEGGDVMENILILPKSNEMDGKLPLIVWPHGGPHTVMSADFSLYLAAFASLGFAVLQVNYRGSTGFGEKSLKSVLGKVGSQDVSDVQRVAEFALQTGKFDKDRVFIFGGSHGGFLSSHLIGQYPNFYRACIIRNPVINIACMTESTDIPDWCYTEVGISYDTKLLPTAEHYAKMLESSPIHHVQKVVTPVLIMIGGKDARVPPSQGRSYYRALKSMQKEVKMLWYPDDCHPINKVDSEACGFISIIKWMQTHM